MIIPENSPDSPTKVRQEQLSSLASNNFIAQAAADLDSPPAYQGPARQAPAPQYQDSSYFPTPTSPLIAKPHQGSTKKRFFKAFLCALALYLFLVLLVRGIVIALDIAFNDVSETLTKFNLTNLIHKYHS